MRFVMMVVVLGCMLPSCVRDELVACGETLCPVGTLCVQATPTVTICAAPDHGECMAIADGELCGEMGRCYDHVCLPIVCGDLLVDSGRAGVMAPEACDDGNTIGGDGCAADCRSDEQCGTGVIDPAFGEACDDGNLLAHDGCSYQCEHETPRWTRVESAIAFRSTPSMGFDPASGRVVMFGGSVAETTTLEWGGRGWSVRPSQFAPSARGGQAAAYHAATGQFVQHGGSFISSLGDTWTLDRSGWTLISSTVSGIGGRANHSMAYDPIRGRTVMFGGEVTEGVDLYFDDTWEWDGSKWLRLSTPMSPSARSKAAMAFDPGRGTIVLFGGQDITGPRDDTWEWNGATWTLLTASASPSARVGATMATHRGGVLLYGGVDGVGGVLSEMWRWTGTGWTSLGNGPDVRANPGLAWDYLRDRLVLFGGTGGVSTSDVWEWDGSQWRNIRPGTFPVTENAAAAFDARRGCGVVVHQGVTLEVFDDSFATLTAATPPARVRHALIYDAARDEVVMFGGDVGGGETWALVATGSTRTWVLRAPPTSPSSRNGQGFAYDTARSRGVIFGGAQGPALNDETWEWDGSTWHELDPPVQPSRRTGHALAYDPIRGVTVLFGGGSQTTTLNDTWEWNGATWTQISPVGALPIPRSGSTLTWNPNRRRLTLVAGVAGALGRLDDAWEWDGSSWTPVPTEVRPSATTGHVTMQTSDGFGILRYGGTDTMGPTNGRWRLRWEGSRPNEQCAGRIDRDGDGAIGCADADCWSRCTPLCAPGVSCATDAPRCGDGTADVLETCQLCPQDAGACPQCGDLLCEPPETVASCPGDCS